MKVIIFLSTVFKNTHDSLRFLKQLKAAERASRLPITTSNRSLVPPPSGGELRGAACILRKRRRKDFVARASRRHVGSSVVRAAENSRFEFSHAATHHTILRKSVPRVPRGVPVSHCDFLCLVSTP